ncbi:MAG: BamA/TamA family outer membrane protein [Gammaproteobacteria bacterium]|nr:BamA/TamA family outer membrane protein [Gammaproteobacteria bacterium]
MNPRSIFVFFICQFFIFISVSHANEKSQAVPVINYQIKIQFINQEIAKEQQQKLETVLLSVSDANRLIDKPGSSILLIKSRARADLELFKSVLNSRGFYDASVQYKLNKTVKPMLINYRVNTGVSYHIGKIELINISNNDPIQVDLLSENELIGQDKSFFKLIESHQFKRADARKIREFEGELIDVLKNLSYANSEIKKNEYRLDKKKKLLNLKYFVSLGQSIKLFRAIFTGIETIDQKFMESKVAWKPGQLYHPKYLDKTFNNIQATGLFSQVRVTLDSSLNKSRNVNIDLKENKHRTIKASIGYDSDKGLSVGSGWQHRNIFGSGEKLTASAKVYTDGIFVDTKYIEQSLFFNQKFETLLELKYDDEITSAYDSQTILSSIALKHKFSKNLSISGGLGFRSSQLSSIDLDNNILSDENYSFIFSPWQLNLSSSNDLLEPSKGGHLFIHLAPYQSIKSSVNFIQGMGSYRHYFSLIKRTRTEINDVSSFVKEPLILAMKLKLSQLLNCELNDVPADLRFYSGGGGSIRGYGRQLVGPLSSDNTPTGGCSSLDFAIETRYKFNKELGLVWFLDGGSAFEKNWLDSSSEILLASGLGVRYSTPIGPLRLDIGMPLDSRDNIDDSYQIYLSIGHAF